MNNIVLYLPFPPSENSYYSHTRRGVYISARGKRYREASLDAIYEQGSPTVGFERVGLKVVLFPPDARARDIDNYDKGLLDALTHAGIWEDDSQVDQLQFYRGAVVKGGSCAIIIQDAGPIIPFGLESTVMNL